MNRCLDDFNKNDTFNSLTFESDYIRQIDFEGDSDNPIFEFKQVLSTRRLPMKKGLRFLVITQTFWKGEEENSMVDNGDHIRTEESAVNIFNVRKEELIHLAEQDKLGRVFDGRRYFWKVENNKILERC